MKKLGQILQMNSSLASDYKNPSGIGDHREISLIDILKEKLPSKYQVSKGEIIDSNGNRSPEFDIIVHYPSSTPNFLNLGDRKVIACEDVLCVAEVKSSYNEERAIKFVNDINKLNSLDRFYKGTKALELENYFALSKYLGNSIKAGENKGIPPVMAFFFSYEGPSSETVLKHLEKRSDIPDNLISFFLLGDAQIMRKDGAWVASPDFHKDDVLFLMFFSLYSWVENVTNIGRELYLRTDSERYMKNFITTYIQNSNSKAHK
jgi:hypothetical protein